MFSRAAITTVQGAARRAPQLAKTGGSRLLSSVEVSSAEAASEAVASKAATSSTTGAASKAAGSGSGGSPPQWKGGMCGGGRYWNAEFAKEGQEFYKVRRGVTPGKVFAVAAIGGTGYMIGKSSAYNSHYYRYPYPYPAGPWGPPQWQNQQGGQWNNQQAPSMNGNNNQVQPAVVGQNRPQQ